METHLFLWDFAGVNFAAILLEFLLINRLGNLSSSSHTLIGGFAGAATFNCTWFSEYIGAAWSNPLLVRDIVAGTKPVKHGGMPSEY
jgi:phosphate/sulfate permease